MQKNQTIYFCGMVGQPEGKIFLSINNNEWAPPYPRTLSSAGLAGDSLCISVGESEDSRGLGGVCLSLCLSGD